MKSLTRLHRYLSCIVAPAMLFFAISGAWQAFRYQESKKDGSYKAPVVLERLSHMHKAEKLDKSAAFAFRTGQVVLASLFAMSALIGLVMAFRVTRPVWHVWACLAIGVGIPVILAVLAAG